MKQFLFLQTQVNVEKCRPQVTPWKWESKLRRICQHHLKVFLFFLLCPTCFHHCSKSDSWEANKAQSACSATSFFSPHTFASFQYKYTPLCSAEWGCYERAAKRKFIWVNRKSILGKFEEDVASRKLTAKTVSCVWCSPHLQHLYFTILCFFLAKSQEKKLFHCNSLTAAFESSSAVSNTSVQWCRRLQSPKRRASVFFTCN